MELQNRYTGIEKPELNILISTSAFGMGIDIPNIRHVIHYSPPQSVTDYVQQIGRRS
jgi:ATP-dependent DNA helicase RecQ